MLTLRYITSTLSLDFWSIYVVQKANLKVILIELKENSKHNQVEIMVEAHITYSVTIVIVNKCNVIKITIAEN
jgi:hypothetical protein